MAVKKPPKFVIFDDMNLGIRRFNSCGVVASRRGKSLSEKDGAKSERPKMTHCEVLEDFRQRLYRPTGGGEKMGRPLFPWIQTIMKPSMYLTLYFILASALCIPSGQAFLPMLTTKNLGIGSQASRLTCVPRISSRSVDRLSMQSANPTNFFSKFARTIMEKAKADVERTKRLFQGLELVRSDMSVIDELLSFWNLQDADVTLEKLEEALITRDFGVSTASRICDALREDIKAGIIKDPRFVSYDIQNRFIIIDVKA